MFNDYEKQIINEMNYNDSIKYNNPYIIALSGMSGSGKTFLSQQLSRKLKIFLLSQDYVRNYYCTNIKEYNEKYRLYIDYIVKKCNLKRFLILSANRISLVLDGNINSKKQYEFLMLLCKILKYDLIKIKINSNDEDNITRIINRNTNFNKIDETIIGDKNNYNTKYTAKEYYKIKNRKTENLKDVLFDYTINNYNSETSYIKEIDDVINNIKKIKLVYK